MTDDVSRDVQIHIHEHVGPLRERVSKLEGRMDVHDRELTLLRQGIENLRDRIDGVKVALLDALDKHTVREEMSLDQHVVKSDELFAAHQALSAKVDGLKAWIIALGLGAGAVVVALQLLERLGVFHR